MKPQVIIILSLMILASVAWSDDLIEASPSLYHGYSDRFLPNEIVVRYKPDVSRADVERFNTLNGVVEIDDIGAFARLRIPDGASVAEYIELYAASGLVEYSEPNYIAKAFMTPNDKYFKYQWNLHASAGGINVEKAWDLSTGEGIVIAVLDTGVASEDYDRFGLAPDLSGTRFVAGYDFVNDDPHPNDDNGHGTHVAGTIAQRTNNEEGTAGVAFDAAIMPVKVLDETGYGNYTDISKGIYYAVDHGANIVNLSLGGGYPSKTMENAVAYAHDRGVLVVAAIGNEYLNGNPTTYPAAYDDYVLAVGATRFDGQRAEYSGTSDHLDVVAPGGDLHVDQNNDKFKDGILQQTFSVNPKRFGYWFFQGTSMAAPHVSGIAALIMATGVREINRVREAIEMTARDAGVPGWDEEYGYGIVDAYAAVAYFLDQPEIDSGIEITALSFQSSRIFLSIANNTGKQMPVIVSATDKATDEPIGIKVLILKTNSQESISLDIDDDGLTQNSIIVVTVAPANDPYTPAATRTFKVEQGGDESNSEDAAPTDIFVSDVNMNYRFRADSWNVIANVKVLSETGDPVPNVMVYGVWHGDIEQQVSGKTDDQGVATFVSADIFKLAKGVSFSVNSIFKTGYRYNPSMNLKEPSTQVSPDRMMLPTDNEIRLLQSFPNPANPEAWIPYETSQSGQVKITIYDARGRVVRVLDLGYRDAGAYIDRSQAAHWDGRNEFGELVASGVYHYSIDIGSLRAVKRLVVMR